MTKEICGIVLNEMPNSLWTEDNALNIFCTDEAEQGFSFNTAEIAPFAGLFSKFNVVSIGVSSLSEEGPLDLDCIDGNERVRKFNLDGHHFPVQVAFSEGKQYFPHLRELSILGQCPDRFFDLSRHGKLEKLTIQYDRHFLPCWINLSQIKDLIIYDYDEPDLAPLLGLTGVHRLHLVRGKTKSLDGLEKFPALRTLHIGPSSKLTNLDALLHADGLTGVMFEGYKKISDFAFLSSKKNLRYISLETADSIDFMKKMPQLEFLFCAKVKDRKNKTYLYERSYRPGEMAEDCIQIDYVETHDQFC